MNADLALGNIMPIPTGPARATSEPVRVLVCAEHAHLRWGLKKLLEAEWPRMLVVGAVSTLSDAESFLRSHAVEVVLLDFPEPDEAMFGEVKRLCRSFPTPFVMLDGDTEVLGCLAGAGMKAVLPLDAPAERILKAIYQAVGEAYEH